MYNTLFKGVGTALITPMKKDGSIHYDKLEKLIEYQIKQNADALIIAGTTGESATLTFPEYEKLISFSVKTVNHRIPVIAGAGSNSTAHAMEHTVMAEKCGADGLLHVTPYYNKASQKGLIAHFTACAKATSLPIILYNVPSRTGVNILPETCARLCDQPNIVAVKEASGDITQVAKIKAICGDRLDVYSGNDDQILPVLSMGGIGVISVLSNILPKQIHEICEDYFKGDIAKARTAQLYYLNLIQALFSDINPIPIKQAMNDLGLDVGSCRLPLCAMEESAAAHLHKILEEYHLI